MKKILLIAGTRPNFIKLAPLYHQLMKEPNIFKPVICHTGQHYDYNMSDIFWENLDLPKTDIRLGVTGNGVVDTVGKIMIELARIIKKELFDLVIVFGDVNATIAGAFTAVQTGIPVMHVEAGLRSFDRAMPEEINRVLTDHVSNHLMVSEHSGIKNLVKEGFDSTQYRLVGNIMIETLCQTELKWRKIKLPAMLENIMPGKPIVATFHRPENVDEKANLERVSDIINGIAETKHVIFPVHPRTFNRLSAFKLIEKLKVNDRIILTEPMGYFEFLNLISRSFMVVTDSGGIQEETSYLKIPCITFRKNTERPSTIEMGTNLLLDIWDNDFKRNIYKHFENLLQKEMQPIPFWDDKVSERIVAYIKEYV